MAECCELAGHDFVRTDDGRNTCRRCGRWFDDACRKLEESRIGLIHTCARFLSFWGISDSSIGRLVDIGKETMDEPPAPPALPAAVVRPRLLCRERRRAYRRKKKRQARRARRR